MATLLRKAATVATAASIAVGGVAGVAGASGAITNTGPHSTNKVINKDNSSWSKTNNNNVGVANTSSQSAYSGSAKVKWNTTGGDATSGMASNDNSVSTTVGITNSGGGSGSGGAVFGGDNSIDTTGPKSTNKVINVDNSTVTLQNNNTVSVSNTSSQTATSGNASVSGNTTGGSATSGDATNTNSTTTSITISN